MKNFMGSMGPVSIDILIALKPLPLDEFENNGLPPETYLGSPFGKNFVIPKPWLWLPDW